MIIGKRGGFVAAIIALVAAGLAAACAHGWGCRPGYHSERGSWSGDVCCPTGARLEDSPEGPQCLERVVTASASTPVEVAASEGPLPVPPRGTPCRSSRTPSAADFGDCVPAAEPPRQAAPSRPREQQEGESAPEQFVAAYTGQYEDSGRYEDGGGICDYEQRVRFSMGVAQGGSVAWVAHAYNGIECRGVEGTDVPTSCWYSGVGTLTPARGPRGSFLLSLERRRYSSVPLPMGPRARLWRCGALDLSLPDSVEPDRVDCVLLGRDEPSVSAEAVQSAACSAGQPLGGMSNLPVRAEGDRLLLQAGRRMAIVLRRVAETTAP